MTEDLDNLVDGDDESPPWEKSGDAPVPEAPKPKGKPKRKVKAKAAPKKLTQKQIQVKIDEYKSVKAIIKEMLDDQTLEKEVAAALNAAILYTTDMQNRLAGEFFGVE